MTYQPGTRLGPYEILAPLGAGGMGEVYRARDTRLDRTVAVKVLPSHLSSDPALRERFEREARAVSSLNHPNICALFDIGEQDGVSYLVMEHIEGETLAARLSKGAMPTEQALRVATEIADALDKAHRQGVVHRDLKPANIMLTKSGAKLLDFGLAKLKPSEPAGAVPGSSALMTQRADLTMQGSIVGTLQYMAPEQLEGREADPRSDIFSFGSVLYEMVTGRKAFEGKSQASVIAAILTSEPQPVSALQPMTPPALDRVVKTCLAKDAEDRWQSARDLTSELKWISHGGSQAGVPAPVASRRRGRERVAWTVAGALAIALALLGIWAARRPAQVKPEAMRFTVSPPDKSSFELTIALSPDGSRLAFVSTQDDKRLLWIRPLNSFEARPLAGTDDATQPFWSPDGRNLGFFAEGKLKWVDTIDGTVQSLASVTDPRGGTWGLDGTIIFSPGTTQSLYQVSSLGGSLRPVTTLPEGSKESSHRWPWMLPDGRHYLFFARSGDKAAEYICLGTLDSTDRVNLAPSHSAAIYASGHILYVRDKTLVAQAFDPERLELSGDPVAVTQNVELVGESGPSAYAAVTAGNNGLLAYLKSGSNLANTLIWFDRTGKELGRVVPQGYYSEPSMSPDGRRVAVGITDPKSGNASIWLVDLADGRLTRFTFGSSDDGTPIWSPDGSRIAYAGNRSGFWDLFVKPANGVTGEEVVLSSSLNKFVDGWTPDGRFLIYEVTGPDQSWDLWLLPVVGKGEKAEPKPFLTTPANETHSAISPDAKWLAYASDESGRSEVYVQTFPAPGGKFQISTEGGDQPLWSNDGKEIYFLSEDRVLTAVSVSTGPSFEAGVPKPLFKARVPTLAPTGARIMYMVSADGLRFLVASFTENAVGEPMRLILNWPSELKR